MFITSIDFHIFQYMCQSTAQNISSSKCTREDLKKVLACILTPHIRQI